LFKFTKTTVAEAFDMEDLESEGWVNIQGFKSAMLVMEDIPNDV